MKKQVVYLMALFLVTCSCILPQLAGGAPAKSVPPDGAAGQPATTMPTFTAPPTAEVQPTLPPENPAVSVTKPPAAASTVTETPDAFTIGSTQTSPKDGMKLVYVPAGSFSMGSENGSKYGGSDEKPVHTVYLDAFWIDRTEVTNAMYLKCVGAGACQAPYKSGSHTRSRYFGDSQFADYPVLYINWNGADAYCGWAGRRLPTEAEWEKAARGPDGRTYPWGEGADKQKANYNYEDANAHNKDTTKVGSFPAGASPYGALDMAGNVQEWVADWYDKTYYQSSPDHNPGGPAPGSVRVARGGSFYMLDSDIISAVRSDAVPDAQVDELGFRCAQSAAPAN